MFKQWLNIAALPVRLILPHNVVEKIGLRSLRNERYKIVIQHCNGRLLDIGCGDNKLVHSYGHESIGIDVYDFDGDALIVENSSSLPFPDCSFQTISFVASLNHIPNRQETLYEVGRLLCDDGQVLVTMISPLVGTIRHHLAWWDLDQHERGMRAGETMGLSYQELLALMDSTGFRLIERKRFILGLNNLYMFEKK